AHARRRPIFALSALPPPPHSFPTRRSSDLFAARLDGAPSERRLSLDQVGWGLIQATEWRWLGDQQLWSLEAYLPLGPAPGRVGRSEEHTSELQSREKIVGRLPLQKKNYEDA